MKIFLTVLTLVVTGMAWAQEPGVVFRQTYPAVQVGPVSDQSFCIEDDRGSVSGNRMQVPQRIASVSKLFTTLLALDAFSAQQKWGTRFTLAGRRLHISGTGDPFFEEEKVLALIESLQRMGVTSLDEVTFNQGLLFTDEQPLSHRPLTSAGVAVALARYFSPSGKFGPAARNSLVLARTYMTEQRADFPLPTTGIATASVRYSANNPLDGLPDARSFTHHSRPLKDILKAMNVYSKNKVAENLWNNANRVRPANQVFAKWGIPTAEIKLRNGSGLAILPGTGRLDNEASCSAILKLLAAIESIAASRGVELEEIIGVGTDLGSYEERFLNDSRVKAAVIAKTGTLRNTSALVGWITGTVPYRFAILNNTGNRDAARAFQDRFLSVWMAGMAGPAQARAYEPLSVYALDREFLD